MLKKICLKITSAKIYWIFDNPTVTFAIKSVWSHKVVLSNNFQKRQKDKFYNISLDDSQLYLLPI